MPQTSEVVNLTFDFVFSKNTELKFSNFFVLDAASLKLCKLTNNEYKQSPLIDVNNHVLFFSYNL